jgi:hypothetical protein
MFEEKFKHYVNFQKMPFSLKSLYQHTLDQLLMLLHDLLAILKLAYNDESERHLKSLGDALMTSFKSEPS